MNTISVQERQVSAVLHQVGGTEWNTAIAYLQEKRYEKVIHLLQEVKETAENNGDAAQVNLLAAAQQICIGCIQHQEAIDLHQQLLAQASSQETELQKQLSQLLQLALKPPTQSLTPFHTNGVQPEDRQVAAGNHPKKPEQNSSLWQRVQRLLGKEPAEMDDTAPPPEPLTESPAFIDEDDQPSHKIPTEPQPATSPPPKEPTLSVYCLGAFRVYANGRLVDNWSGNKSKTIFKHMLVHRDRPANHEILMELFWPGEETDLARRNLYQAIYMIRQALQQDDADFSYIVCQDGAYSFNPELSLWVDSSAFETHYKEGVHLERQGKQAEAVLAFEAADSLYEGDFLAEDVYEEWLPVHRERLKHAHFDLLDRLSQHYWTTKQFNICITYCLKILRGDSCREDVHRRLMLAYLRQGQRHLALRQYHRCMEALARELDVDPMPATEKLYRQIVNNDVQTPTD